MLFRSREAEEREAAEREAEAKARAKARAKAEAEAREADRRTIDEEGDPEARAADGPPVGKIVGGVSMLAGGLGSGAFSVLAYTQATRAYTDYNNKVENAGDDKQRQRLADDYYDSTVVPRRNLFYGTAAAGGLLLAGGIVVLAIDDRLPTLAPAPGGGMLLWSGRF